MQGLGFAQLPPLRDDLPVLIAGPTASGKSALALAIAEAQGGVIVNADASQVWSCWRLITARPSVDEEARATHALYGHLPWDAEYSAGDWLREVTPLLAGQRPIIVGGTGLYFSALTEGMAAIPPVPPEVRAEADALSLETLRAGVDAATLAGIDAMNRARVQRAWEVERATGRPLSAWQAETPPPLLPLERAQALVLDAPKDWLGPRLEQRFDAMLEAGALEEVEAMRDLHDPARPVFRAIGVPELMDHVQGHATLEDARARAIVATRQYAKRQRTWFRARMRRWSWISPEN